MLSNRTPTKIHKTNVYKRNSEHIQRKMIEYSALFEVVYLHHTNSNYGFNFIIKKINVRSNEKESI